MPLIAIDILVQSKQFLPGQAALDLGSTWENHSGAQLSNPCVQASLFSGMNLAVKHSPRLPYLLLP